MSGMRRLVTTGSPVPAPGSQSPGGKRRRHTLTLTVTVHHHLVITCREYLKYKQCSDK